MTSVRATKIGIPTLREKARQRKKKCGERNVIKCVCVAEWHDVQTLHVQNECEIRVGQSLNRTSLEYEN